MTFAPGETSGIASFIVYGDRLDENTCTTPSGPAALPLADERHDRLGLRRIGFALILDDDPPPTSSPLRWSVVEGNIGDTTLLVKFDLSAPSGRTVSVNWATLDSLAQPRPGSTRAWFRNPHVRPGETSKTVPFVVHGDTLDEPGLFYGADGVASVVGTDERCLRNRTLARIGLALIVDDD